MKRTFSLLALVVILSSCSCGVRSMVYSESNKEEVTKAVVESKTLSSEEKGLFVAYFARVAMQAIPLFGALAAKGGKIASPNGKTVQQILDEQRAWIAEEKKQEEGAKHLAAEAKAREEAQVSALRRVVSLVPFAITSDERSFVGSFEMKVACQNTSDREVRAFEGRLIFRDVLGEELADMKVKEIRALKAGEKRTLTVSGAYLVQSKMRDKGIDDLRSEWKPLTVLFSDGTRLDAGEKKGEE